MLSSMVRPHPQQLVSGNSSMADAGIRPASAGTKRPRAPSQEKATGAVAAGDDSSDEPGNVPSERASPLAAEASRLLVIKPVVPNHGLSDAGADALKARQSATEAFGAARHTEEPGSSNGAMLPARAALASRPRSPTTGVNSSVKRARLDVADAASGTAASVLTAPAAAVGAAVAVHEKENAPPQLPRHTEGASTQPDGRHVSIALGTGFPPGSSHGAVSSMRATGGRTSTDAGAATASTTLPSTALPSSTDAHTATSSDMSSANPPLCVGASCGPAASSACRTVSGTGTSTGGGSGSTSGAHNRAGTPGQSGAARDSRASGASNSNSTAGQMSGSAAPGGSNAGNAHAPSSIGGSAGGSGGGGGGGRGHHHRRKSSDTSIGSHVRFARGTKPHDGPLPIHAAFDRLVWNFCTGRLSAPLALPLVETGPVDDAFAYVDVVIDATPAHSAAVSAATDRKVGGGVGGSPATGGLRRAEAGDIMPVLVAMEARHAAIEQAPAVYQALLAEQRAGHDVTSHEPRLDVEAIAREAVADAAVSSYRLTQQGLQQPLLRIHAPPPSPNPSSIAAEERSSGEEDSSSSAGEHDHDHKHVVMRLPGGRASPAPVARSLPKTPRRPRANTPIPHELVETLDSVAGNANEQAAAGYDGAAGMEDAAQQSQDEEQAHHEGKRRAGLQPLEELEVPPAQLEEGAAAVTGRAVDISPTGARYQNILQAVVDAAIEARDEEHAAPPHPPHKPASRRTALLHPPEDADMTGTVHVNVHGASAAEEVEKDSEDDSPYGGAEAGSPPGSPSSSSALEQTHDADESMISTCATLTSLLKHPQPCPCTACSKQALRDPAGSGLLADMLSPPQSTQAATAAAARKAATPIRFDLGAAEAGVADNSAALGGGAAARDRMHSVTAEEETLLGDEHHLHDVSTAAHVVLDGFPPAPHAGDMHTEELLPPSPSPSPPEHGTWMVAALRNAAGTTTHSRDAPPDPTGVATMRAAIAGAHIGAAAAEKAVRGALLFGAGDKLGTVTIPRRMWPEVPPPHAAAAAVEVVYHDRRYADGDVLLLRGMLCLAEGLEARLQRGIDGGGSSQGSNEVEKEEEEEQEQHSEMDDAVPHGVYVDTESDDDDHGRSHGGAGSGGGRGSSGGGGYGYDGDNDDDGLFDFHDDDDPLEALVQDAAAEAAAAAYRAKRSALSVPVLMGGGGSSAKLGGQHLPIAHQMVLLLRHAVRAYPPEPKDA